MNITIWLPLVGMLITVSIAGAVLADRKLSRVRAYSTLLAAAVAGLAGGLAYAVPHQAADEREARIQSCMKVITGTDPSATQRACDTIDPAEHKEAADRLLRAYRK